MGPFDRRCFISETKHSKQTHEPLTTGNIVNELIGKNLPMYVKSTLRLSNAYVASSDNQYAVNSIARVYSGWKTAFSASEMVKMPMILPIMFCT